MKTYLVEFANGESARLVAAEGWLDDGRSYLMLDRFRLDHDARFEHREVVESFAKADLAEPPRLVELAAPLISEPSGAYVTGGQFLAEYATATDSDEALLRATSG